MGYGRGYSYSYSENYGSDPLDRLVNPVRTVTSQRALNNILVETYRSQIALLDDRRVYNPDPLRRPMASLRSASDVVTRPRVFDDWSTAHASPVVSRGLSFRDPSRVALCAKRHIRREVLMAKGKGGGKHKPPKRNDFSDIGC